MRPPGSAIAWNPRKPNEVGPTAHKLSFTRSNGPATIPPPTGQMPAFGHSGMDAALH
jgi:hypothetical protein